MSSVNVAVVPRRRKDRPLVYCLRWTDPKTGDRKERSAKTSKQKKAFRLAAELETQLNSGAPVDADRMTWIEFREMYEQDTFHELSHGAMINKSNAFDQFEKLAPVRYLSDLDSDVVSLFQRALQKRKLAHATIRYRLGVVRTMVRWGRRRGLITWPIVFRMSKRKRGERLARSRPVTAEEFDRMIEVTPQIRKTESEENGDSSRKYCTGVYLWLKCTFTRLWETVMSRVPSMNNGLVTVATSNETRWRPALSTGLGTIHGPALRFMRWAIVEGAKIGNDLG